MGCESLNDQWQIVNPGDPLGIATEGADPTRVVAEVQYYGGEGNPPDDFHLEPILSLTTFVFVDGRCNGPSSGHVYPSQFAVKKWGFRRYHPKVELVSFEQHLTMVAAGITADMKLYEKSEGRIRVEGTARIQLRLSESNIDRITNLFNSKCAERLTVFTNPGEVCRLIRAANLQKMISTHVQDISRSVISPNSHLYSELDRIEKELTDKMRNDIYFEELGLVIEAVSVRMDATPLEKVESEEVQAYLRQRYRQLNLEEFSNKAKFNCEKERIQKKG